MIKWYSSARTHARGKAVDKFPLGAKCTVEYRSGVLLLLLPVSLSSLFSLFLFRSLGCASRKLWPVIYTPYGNRHWRLREHAPRRRRPRRFNTGDPFIYPVAVAVFNNRRARETYQRATGCGCFFVLDLTATTKKRRNIAPPVLCCAVCIQVDCVTVNWTFFDSECVAVAVKPVSTTTR